MAAEWQKCSVCNGTGYVSGGYFNRAGDYEYSTSTSATEVCWICGGKGIIVKPEEEQDDG